MLLGLLACVGGAWSGHEGQGLGSFGSDLGLSTMLGVLSAPRGHGVCIDSFTNQNIIVLATQGTRQITGCLHLATIGYIGCSATPCRASLCHTQYGPNAIKWRHVAVNQNTVEYERMFSTLGYIRNPQRNRLHAQHLMCCAQGFKSSASSAEFISCSQAILDWLRAKKRSEIK